MFSNDGMWRNDDDIDSNDRWLQWCVIHEAHYSTITQCDDIVGDDGW